MTTTHTTHTHYIVQTAAAAMPGSCWGVYRRVAVLEVREGVLAASMISERAVAVVAVVATWERRNVGRVHRRGGEGRCAYSRALAEATELAEELNAARVVSS